MGDVFVKKLQRLCASLFFLAALFGTARADGWENQLTTSIRQLQASSQAAQPLDGTGAFLFDEEDLNVTYGQYVETEVSLAQPISGQW